MSQGVTRQPAPLRRPFAALPRTSAGRASYWLRSAVYIATIPVCAGPERQKAALPMEKRGLPVVPGPGPVMDQRMPPIE